MQVRMAYKGIKYSNRALPIIGLYQQRKIMQKLGITDSIDELEDWELSAYMVIENEIAKLEKIERTKKNGSRRKN